MADANITTKNTGERYEIHVDGERAGLADYVDTGGQRIFHHTTVDDRFSGQGLAGKLIAAALDETRAAGKRVVPICSFVASTWRSTTATGTSSTRSPTRRVRPSRRPPADFAAAQLS
ncbi:GNAT family N-acetyltransferase [Mycolicibacillus trivialis]